MEKPDTIKISPAERELIELYRAGLQQADEYLPPTVLVAAAVSHVLISICRGNNLPFFGVIDTENEIKSNEKGPVTMVLSTLSDPQISHTLAQTIAFLYKFSGIHKDMTIGLCEEIIQQISFALTPSENDTEH